MAVLRQILKPRNAPKRQRLTVNLDEKGSKSLQHLRQMINARWNRSAEPSMSAVIDVAIYRMWVELGRNPSKAAELVAELERVVYPMKPTTATRQLAKAYSQAVADAKEGK